MDGCRRTKYTAVNAQSLVLRFHDYSPAFKSWLCLSTQRAFALAGIRESLVRVYNINEGTSKLDLEDAMAGLLNIQLVHNLKADDLGYMIPSLIPIL